MLTSIPYLRDILAVLTVYRIALRMLEFDATAQLHAGLTRPSPVAQFLLGPTSGNILDCFAKGKDSNVIHPNLVGRFLTWA